MKCSRCGHLLDEKGDCSFCGAHEEPQVRVMSKEEGQEYQGITIDETDNAETSVPKHEPDWKSQGLFMKSTVWGGNWASKAALILLIAAVVGFVVFIALPVAVVGLLIGGVVWLLLSFLRS